MPDTLTKDELLALAARVLDIEARAVETLKSRLGDDFVAACDLCMDTPGRVVVTGMGKSGHVSNKIAATLASTGTPAFFMHPAEASHGDLGMITSQDLLIAISYSGETAEVVTILPVVKRMGARLLAITRSQPRARFMPAPTATPSTAATVGFETRWSASAALFGRRMYSAFSAGVPNPEKSAPRFAPAQNSPPAPVITSTRCSDASNASNAAASSAHPLRGTAFLVSGDDSVTHRTLPRSSTSTNAMNRT